MIGRPIQTCFDCPEPFVPVEHRSEVRLCDEIVPLVRVDGSNCTVDRRLVSSHAHLRSIADRYTAVRRSAIRFRRSGSTAARPWTASDDWRVAVSAVVSSSSSAQTADRAAPSIRLATSPTSTETTGVLHASASLTAFGDPSWVEVSMSASAAFMYVGTLSWATPWTTSRETGVSRRSLTASMTRTARGWSFSARSGS